ncbi:MAG: hypothetical protein R3B45_12445 [Bdellovibrionota bacterium]
MASSNSATKSFNRAKTFNGEPDYEFWKQKEVWLLPDAAKLLCGRDPMSKYPGRPIYNKKLKVIDIIDRAFAATKLGNLSVQREALLPNHILLAPKDFLQWAQYENLEMPDPLQELCSEASPTKEVTSHDIMKERVQTAAKVLWYNKPNLDKATVISHDAMQMIVGDETIPYDLMNEWISQIMPEKHNI